MGISKDEALKKIQDSSDSEFEVFSTKEHKTFIDNLVEVEVDKQLKPKVSEIHKQYDDDLFNLTGKRRAENQKTYDFLKETYTDLSENTKRVIDLQQEIETLKSQIKDGKGSESLKADLEKVRQQFTEAKKAWETEKQELTGKQQRMVIDNELDKAIVGIKFKESIPENVRNVMIRQVKDNLIEKAQLTDDGKLIFVDKDGATLRNENNALNPFTPKEMMQVQLKDIIGEEKVITGTGVKPELIERDGKKDIVISIPDSVKTKDDLSKHLMSLGLTRNSEDYQVAYAKYSPDLKYAEV